VTCRLLIRKRARLDALTAIEWYQSEGGDLGGRFATTLEAAVLRIHEQPPTQGSMARFAA